MKRWLFALPVLFAPDVAEACAPAPPHGHDVIIAAEEAIVAWDPATKTEHFVRRAQFESTAKDFGFLVPTPAPPQLAEADPSVFARLDTATKPLSKDVDETVPQLSCLSFVMLKSARDAAPAQPAVRVLSVEYVAGYEASILQANDAEALRKWLADHAYEARPALTAWLEPYVQNKWTVTAFKIVDQANTGRPTSSAVRMTFPSERPFYPYREPSDQSKATFPPRTLRVFLVTPEGRVGGAVGKNAWPGELRYARKQNVSSLLGSAVPGFGEAWLHDFVDPSTPRPGTDDLFFAAAPSQAEVIPPPIVHVRTHEVYLPIDLIAVAGLGIALTLRITRRKRG